VQDDVKRHVAIGHVDGAQDRFVGDGFFDRLSFVKFELPKVIMEFGTQSLDVPVAVPASPSRLS
jgi:hypothetical protein